MTDGEKYTKLLLRHRKLVWRLCRRYARGDYDRCADLVQEVAVALWEYYGRLRVGATVGEERIWVLWYTRRTLHNLHRRPQPEFEPVTDEMADRVSEESHREGELVEAMLESLSEEERELIRLRLDGYDAEEIGRMKALTADAVYQKIHRAIKKLKKRYHGE